MPFKHNAARRHRILKTRYRVQNWPTYEAGLKRRGDLTLWLDEAALAKWQAPRRTTPGGQARYSDAAIELVSLPRNWWTPLVSSERSGKVSNGSGRASFYG
jgi:hypothetical protein